VYKKLLSANKLPLLDSEKEEEIIEKSNEIFKTKKSWYLSSKYLYEEVTNPDQGYPVYGNQKIKDKLIQLLKMKIQCRLKELLYKEEKREQIKVSLEYLISQDGDLCPDCYIHDEEHEKIIKDIIEKYEENNGYEPDPDDYKINFFDRFYNLSLFSLSPDLYDYIWVANSYRFLSLEMGMEYVVLATIYGEKFLDDISKGKITYYHIQRLNGNTYPSYKLPKVLTTILEVNPELVGRKKELIKEIMLNFALEHSNWYKSRIEEGIKKRKEVKEGESIEPIFILNECDLKEREGTLFWFEQLGTKDDIDGIKKLTLDLPLDYPIREDKKEIDEKYKEEYLQKVKVFQSRVNTLIERLSRQ